MRSALKFSMPAKPPCTLKAPFFDLRTVYGGLPPQMPTEFCPLMKPTLATFFAMASTSPGFNWIWRPMGMP